MTLESYGQRLLREEALRKSVKLDFKVADRPFMGEMVPQDPNEEPAWALLARIKSERQTKHSILRTKYTIRRNLNIQLDGNLIYNQTYNFCYYLVSYKKFCIIIIDT